RIGRAWHSVQGHCFRLQIDGKINGFQVGRMNLWTIKKQEQNEKESNETEKKSKEKNQEKTEENFESY
ncbi:hypothetical protein ACFL6I_22830, partial [candidate division KSB1 bacterium]